MTIHDSLDMEIHNLVSFLPPASLFTLLQTFGSVRSLTSRATAHPHILLLHGPLLCVHRMNGHVAHLVRVFSPLEWQKETFSVCHSCVPRPPPSLTGHSLRTDPTDECRMALYPPFRAVGCQRDTMAPFPSHPHSLPPPLLFRLKKVLKCHIPDPSEFFSQLKSEHGGDFQVGVWSWWREAGIWLRLAGGRPEV